MQLRTALDTAATRLNGGPHPDRARRDAEALLCFVSGHSHASLLAHATEELDAAHGAEFDSVVERRRAGEPIQYITGETEFYGLPFHVTRDVLIPRPETEHLVERVIELAHRFPAPHIVDVGTGSGAIPVALAHALPNASVTTIDLSSAALAVARRNAACCALAERIRFLEGDLLTPVTGELFELIVSNPPYVPTADRGALSVEVRDFEPELALFAGEDGLDIYRRLIPSAFAALVPGGSFVFEIGFGQSDAVRSLLTDTGFTNVGFTADLQGITRVAEGLRP
jgi:release factor glutamine methyltransferase